MPAAGAGLTVRSVPIYAILSAVFKLLSDGRNRGACRVPIGAMAMIQTPELRRSGIGASDAAGVLGLSPWSTPLQVYLEKIGEAEPIEETEAMHFGNVLESIVADEFVRRTGKKVRKTNKTWRLKDQDYVLGHPDRLLAGKFMGLECKTTSAFYDKDEWGDEGSDKVPIHYFLQCQHYMLLTGFAGWYLAVLIGGNKFCWYEIPRDEAILDTMRTRYEHFWTNHVLARIPPAPTNKVDLRLLYPDDSGESAIASGNVEEAVKMVRKHNAEIKRLKDEKDAVETFIQKEMGNAMILQAPSGATLATWKTQERKGYEVAPTKMRVFRLAGEK